MKRIDHEPTNDGETITCPWCGELLTRDLWEITKNEEGEIEEECWNCERTVLLDTMVNVMTTAKRGHGTVISPELGKMISVPAITVLGSAIRYMIFGPMPVSEGYRSMVTQGLLRIARQAYTSERYARSFVMEGKPGWFEVTSLSKEDPPSMNCMVCGKGATRAFHSGLAYKVIEDQLVTLCAIPNCEFSYIPYCNIHEP